MKNKLISWEEFEKGSTEEAERLVQYFEKTESPIDACKHFIFDLITQLPVSHITAVGILSETLLDWREVSNRVLMEEAQNV